MISYSSSSAKLTDSVCRSRTVFIQNMNVCSNVHIACVHEYEYNAKPALQTLRINLYDERHTYTDVLFWIRNDKWLYANVYAAMETWGTYAPILEYVLMRYIMRWLFFAHGCSTAVAAAHNCSYTSTCRHRTMKKIIQDLKVVLQICFEQCNVR